MPCHPQHHRESRHRPDANRRHRDPREILIPVRKSRSSTQNKPTPRKLPRSMDATPTTSRTPPLWRRNRHLRILRHQPTRLSHRPHTLDPAPRNEANTPTPIPRSSKSEQVAYLRRRVGSKHHRMESRRENRRHLQQISRHQCTGTRTMAFRPSLLPCHQPKRR